MSFILDALRKSESRRRAGEGLRLDGLPSINDPAAGRRRNRPLRFLLLVLALMLPIGGLLAFWLTSDRFSPFGDASSPTQAQQSPIVPAAIDDDDEQATDSTVRRERAETTVAGQLVDERSRPRERIISDPDEIARELDRMAASGELGLSPPDAEEDGTGAERMTALPGAGRRAPPRPVDEVAQTEAERQQTLAEQRALQRRDEPESRPIGITIEPTRDRPAAEPDRTVARIEPLPAPEPARETTPEMPSEALPDRQPARAEPADLSQGVAEYLRSWELPLSVRRNLPAMTLNIHVFSTEPDRRFVLVNGQRYVTGDLVADGVRLVDIRREGAILDFREHRFLLEP